MLKLIKIKGGTCKATYSKLLTKIKKSPLKSYDKELKKEIILLFEIDSPSKANPISYDGKIFSTNKKIKFNKIELKVMSHYKELFNKNIKWIINYLQKSPYSKRAILTFWDKKFSRLNIRAPCTTSIFFRLDGKNFNMNVHMRANDINNKMLLNLLLFSALQKYISDELNLKVGKYIHFVDSAHIYR
ncbi:thymidylate synthase [Nanoarchaeota archaeon]